MIITLFYSFSSFSLTFFRNLQYWNIGKGIKKSSASEIFSWRWETWKRKIGQIDIVLRKLIDLTKLFAFLVPHREASLARPINLVGIPFVSRKRAARSREIRVVHFEHDQGQWGKAFQGDRLIAFVGDGWQQYEKLETLVQPKKMLERTVARNLHNWRDSALAFSSLVLTQRYGMETF